MTLIVWKTKQKQSKKKICSTEERKSYRFLNNTRGE